MASKQKTDAYNPFTQWMIEALILVATGVISARYLSSKHPSLLTTLCAVSVILAFCSYSIYYGWYLKRYMVFGGLNGHFSTKGTRAVIASTCFMLVYLLFAFLCWRYAQK